MKPFVLAAAATLTAAAFQIPDPFPDDAPARDLERSFAAQGVHLDVAAGLCAIGARILVREELLEYVLVGEHGATHESLLGTNVRPSVLNAALLALGVEPGTNMLQVPIDPPPSAEEVAAGAATHELVPPAGDGFHCYVAWREGPETYFYRLEDLVRNLDSGRAMRRHEFVYLGSRWIERTPGAEREFAADLLHNLVSLTLFPEGDALLTAALPEALSQTIWIANSWLLPPRGAAVTFVLSRSRLTQVPEALAAELVDVAGHGDERRR